MSCFLLDGKLDSVKFIQGLPQLALENLQLQLHEFSARAVQGGFDLQ